MDFSTKTRRLLLSFLTSLHIMPMSLSPRDQRKREGLEMETKLAEAMTRTTPKEREECRERAQKEQIQRLQRLLATGRDRRIRRTVLDYFSKK